MKKVVSATLAGALAVGAVPMMAMADDDAIELQASSRDDVEAGSITGFDTAAQAAQVAANTFVANDDPEALVPALVPSVITGVTTDYDVEGVEYYEVLENAAGATAEFVIGGKTVYAVEVAPADLMNGAPYLPGDYIVKAGVDFDDDGAVDHWAKGVAQFTILPAELTGATAYEVAANPADISDEVLVWNDAGFTFDGNTHGMINVKIGDRALPNYY